MIICENKTLSQLAVSNSNGLGTVECLSASVTESLNGEYELEFEVAISDPHFADLQVGGYVKSTGNDHDGLQLFKIYSISKAINGVCVVRCEHCSYDLTKVPVSPFTATGASASVSGMNTNVIGSTPFTLTTDITNTVSNFTLDRPRSFRECLGGYEGSLLDVFRGEYHWDNLSVEMLTHRGSDNGVRISYGKNLTDLKQEENIESVYTSVLGYAIVDEVCYVGSVYDKVVTTDPKVLIVDFSNDYETGDVPTSAELTTKAQTYATNNPIEVPKVSLTVSYVHLWQTEEYKDVLPVERVSLGDTVHVYFEKLGVEASARVIKTVWNPLLSRYDSIELGSARANLNTLLDDVQTDTLEAVQTDRSAIENEMFSLSRLVVNGMGLHISKDAQGRIILHNAEDISQSQYQYMISSAGFVLSDDYGQNWNSGWDISGNAVVNSLATITLKFLQGYGMYMRFGDVNSNYIEVAPYSVNNVPQGVSFDGSGSIRMQPQESFFINNTDGNGYNYNRFYMNKNGANSNLISLENRDETKGFALANQIQLQAHNNNTANLKNVLLAYNYATVTENNVNKSYLANYLEMQAFEDSNYVYLYNRKSKSAQNANYMNLSSSSSVESLALYNKSLNDDRTANYAFLGSYAAHNEINFTNFRDVAGNYYANRLFMDRRSSVNEITLRNYKANNTNNTDEFSNEIQMFGYATNSGNSNLLAIRNYDIDGVQIANYLTMRKSSDTNSITLVANRGGTGIAHLDIGRNSGQAWALLGIDENQDYGYQVAQINLWSNGHIDLVGSGVWFNGVQKW